VRFIKINKKSEKQKEYARVGIEPWISQLTPYSQDDNDTTTLATIPMLMQIVFIQCIPQAIRSPSQMNLTL